MPAPPFTPEAPPPPHRSLGMWIVLLAVWAAGLCVWAVYLAIIFVAVVRVLG